MVEHFLKLIAQKLRSFPVILRYEMTSALLNLLKQFQDSSAYFEHCKTFSEYLLPSPISCPLAFVYGRTQEFWLITGLVISDYQNSKDQSKLSSLENLQQPLE